MKGYADSVNILSFTNDLGIEMIARLVHKGDKYGLNGCLTHDTEEPLVEFYDARYNHNELFGFCGQFVGRYYLSTLEEDRRTLVMYGLDLDGGIPDWKVSGENMQVFYQWIEHLRANQTLERR
jgi:hypothetical protein